MSERQRVEQIGQDKFSGIPGFLQELLPHERPRVGRGSRWQAQGFKKNIEFIRGFRFNGSEFEEFSLEK